jgi:hypothetical protein
MMLLPKSAIDRRKQELSVALAGSLCDAIGLKAREASHHCPRALRRLGHATIPPHYITTGRTVGHMGPQPTKKTFSTPAAFERGVHLRFSGEQVEKPQERQRDRVPRRELLSANFP